MQRTSRYPVGNQLRVFIGAAVLTGAAFPPLLFITVPLIIKWYNDTKQFDRDVAARAAIIAAEQEELAVFAAYRSLPR